jgi:hypothetical protein
VEIQGETGSLLNMINIRLMLFSFLSRIDAVNKPILGYFCFLYSSFPFLRSL